MSSEEENTVWQVGQKAAIDRRTIVTVEHVTKSGRAVVGNRTFESNGRERTRGDSYRRAKLEPLTSEIAAEVALVERGKKAFSQADRLLGKAQKLVRGALSPWNSGVPDAADVERVERLIEAIKSVLETSDA